MDTIFSLKSIDDTLQYILINTLLIKRIKCSKTLVVVLFFLVFFYKSQKNTPTVYMYEFHADERWIQTAKGYFYDQPFFSLNIFSTFSSHKQPNNTQTCSFFTSDWYCLYVCYPDDTDNIYIWNILYAKLFVEIFHFFLCHTATEQLTMF